MLNEKMLNALNEQIQIESQSSNLYLQMSAWCSYKGFDGAAKYLHMHAEEERMHMMKLFTYVTETGNLALLGKVDQLQSDYESLKTIFFQILEHERWVTSKINDLVSIAYEEKDYSSLNFLQWYVAEQHEEESLFSSLIDKLNLVGDDGRGMYLFDRDLGMLAASAPAPAPASQA